jgi:hypothetical protein
MMGLRCWGCGCEGKVREQYAGLRVTCKWCRAVNLVPDSVTQEVLTADWIAEIDRTSIPETVEIEIPAPMKAAV